MNEVYQLRAEIRAKEKERDRNLKINCPFVAARLQREIDKLQKEIDRLNSVNNENEDRTG